ncbi:TPM domain-containing protein [Porphyrobacter sp. AAP82]|uniref:TPM domain-containing protein n=1 Tax=Porphyrobacter sp. AAP82 TaxID=1248917 RepID=UPI0002E15B72|nr:TPM domain-containing protein [Porphyrobacter sp. AAP82]
MSLRHLLALCWALLALVAAPLAAQTLPARPDGPVLDQAGIIPEPDEAALDAKLRAYTKATGRVIAVATVSSLEGQDPATYARDLAEAWDLGGKETEEAVLLLIAPNEREMWITTARGVQDRLTDLFTGQVVRTTLRLAFREGDFGGGIARATDQMIERLNLSPADAKAIAEAEAAAKRNSSDEGGFPVGVLIWLAFMFFFFILPIIASRGRRRRYRSRGAGPWGSRDLGDTARDVILWEVGSAIARGLINSGGGRGGGGGDWGGGGGGGFGGFGGGGGGFNGGGAGGSW